MTAPGASFDRHEDPERCLRRFEDEWRSGQAPALETFLPPLTERWQDDPVQRELVIELIAIDLEYRFRHVGEARLEDYCLRFSLGDVSSLPLEMIEAEHEARCHAGEGVDIEAFLARFPAQADALRPMLANRLTEPTLVAEIGEDTGRGETLVDAPGATVVSLLQSLDILEAEHRESLAQFIQSGTYPTGAAALTVAVERGWLTAFQAEQILAGRGEQLLQGPYVLLRLLGEGGMSKVYLARHRLLGRNVAFKVIRRAFIADAGEVAVQRFYQEMQAVGRLSHPNLVHAYDAGPVGATHFLAMEYVDGIDLQRLVREQGPRPWPEACHYIYHAALGLQHVFERGLVHRDLKPSNLLVAGGVVKILDLGLASLRWSEGSRSRAALTGTDAFLGTPDFIAPEQVLDPTTADIRADLYSLGCTFYHLLVGAPPFPGGTMTHKVQRHLQEAPPPVRAARPDVPGRVAAIIDRLLAKAPDDRFATPRELADALASAAFAEAAPLAAEVPADRSRSRRRVWIAATILACLAVGVVTVAIAAWPGRTRIAAEPPDPLDVAWETLRSRVPASDAEREPLRRALVEFHARHPDTRQGEQAAIAAAKLPSALDRLGLMSEDTRGLVAAFDAHPCPVYGVSIAPDGLTLATSGSSDPVIKIWELRGRAFRLREKLTGHEGGVHSVRFAPDGRTLLSTSFDQTARLWDLSTTPARTRHVFRGVPGCVETAVFSLDGRQIFAGGVDGVTRRCPMVRNGVGASESLPGLVPGTEILTFNREGALMAVGGGGIRLWSLGSERSQERGTIPGAGMVYALGFSPDSRLLASGNTEGVVHIWDLSNPSATPRVLREHQGPVITTVFAADGSFYSAANDGRLIRWKVPTWSKIEEWRLPGPIHRGDFAPDRRHFFTANNNGTITAIRLTPREP
jgi:serine/threonine protein kinase/WD40 repeat protein